MSHRPPYESRMHKLARMLLFYPCLCALAIRNCYFGGIGIASLGGWELPVWGGLELPVWGNWLLGSANALARTYPFRCSFGGLRLFHTCLGKACFFPCRLGSTCRETRVPSSGHTRVHKLHRVHPRGFLSIIYCKPETGQGCPNLRSLHSC